MLDLAIFEKGKEFSRMLLKAFFKLNGLALLVDNALVALTTVTLVEGAFEEPAIDVHATADAVRFLL